MGKVETYLNQQDFDSTKRRIEQWWNGDEKLKMLQLNMLSFSFCFDRQDVVGLVYNDLGKSLYVVMKAQIIHFRTS